jgi:hypothetical protein
MPQNIIEFKDVAGKIIERITLTNGSDFRCVSLRFTDRTDLHFTLCPRIEIAPELMDWKTGDGKVLKEFPVIYETRDDEDQIEKSSSSG